MTTLHIFERAFFFAPVPLLAVLLITMLVRQVYRVLPYFFCYNATLLLQDALLLRLGPESRLYTDVYLSFQLISWALGLAIIYEIYGNLLREYPVLRKIGTVLFWVTAGILLAIAAWTAYQAPGADVERLARGFHALERSVRIVQCGLLLALFVFASFFGLSWKNQLFGIALGFAVFAFSDLAVVALRAYTGHPLSSFYKYLNPASWDVALVIWTFYVIKDWRPTNLPKLPKDELAGWNDTLRDLLHR